MANFGNLYPNLPGMLIEFKDGGSALRFDNDDVVTDSVLYLGTAIDGPVMEPVAVDINTAELVFGSDVKQNGVPNGSNLIHAFKQAYAAGCRDIRLMRISGENAVGTISAPSEKVTSRERVDEDLGIIQGNDLCTFTLAGTNIDPSTVTVYAKGLQLNSGFKYDPLTNEVELAKGACDAGSSISIKYEFTDVVSAAANNFTVNTSKEIVLPKTPISTTVVVKDSTSAVIPSSDYTVANNRITFTTLSTVNSGDVLEVTYDYNQTGYGTESGSGSTPFMAATSDQVVILTNKPVVNSTVLYIEEGKILDTSAFSVDVQNKTVKIKKEKFKKGEKISVSYYIEHDVTVNKEIKLESVFAGSVYNSGTVEVNNITDSTGTIIGKAVKITKPVSKQGTGEMPQIYTSFDFPTFGDLVDAINENNSVYKASTDTPLAYTEDLNISNSYFVGGDDGLNLTKDQIFERLSGLRDQNGYILKKGAYQLLENYQTDWVVPVGVYADDKLADRHQDFAYELALFCAVVSARNKTTFGAIAMKENKDTTLAGIQDYAKYLANFNNLYLLRDSTGAILKNDQGEPFDIGNYISVVAGPEPYFNHKTNALRAANPAVMYAAFNTNLQAQSAPTNKRLEGSTGIKYSFSNAQLDAIVGNRLVVFGTKYARNGKSLAGCYIIDGPTSARPESEYGRLTTNKVMRVVADNIREVCEPFIGEPNNIEERNALSAAISKRLDILIERGVIIDYSFNLISTAIDQLLGQARLELGIFAPQELRKITTVMGLKR